MTLLSPGRGCGGSPLFREQSYRALSRQDAARRADLGTYWGQQALRPNLTARRRTRHHPPWHQRPNASLRPSPPPRRGGPASRTRCLEDQPNASGTVRDVGIYLPADSLLIGIGRDGCYTRWLQAGRDGRSCNAARHERAFRRRPVDVSLSWVCPDIRGVHSLTVR